MDDIVTQAMARWPDVPAVYGWLRLDRRGRWLVKGEPIGHRPTVDFIGRNYQCDADGRFFFQNGPQRVFVDLDYLPYVLRLDGAGARGASLVTHADAPVERPLRGWLDADGGLIVEFERDGATGDAPAVGAVLDRDLPALVDCFTDAEGRPLDDGARERLFAGEAFDAGLSFGHERIPVAVLPPDKTFPFVRLPRPAPGEDACT